MASQVMTSSLEHDGVPRVVQPLELAQASMQALHFGSTPNLGFGALNLVCRGRFVACTEYLHTV